MAEYDLVQNSKARSAIWIHFALRKSKTDGKIDEAIAVCSVCEAYVKFSGGTTNLTYHMNRHHPGKIGHYKKTDNRSSMCTDGSSSCDDNSDVSKAKVSPPTQRTLPGLLGSKYPSHSSRALLIIDKVSRFIIKDLRPYRIVDSPEFRDLLHTLDPRYNVPGREQFAEVIIPKKYVEVKALVTEDLRNAEKVALTTDSWTSRSTESYLTVTSTHIDKDLKLINYVLQTQPLYEGHTGENITAVIHETIKEWEIQSTPMLPIVSDNASNMAKAGTLLGCNFHIKCYAHTINLIAQKCLKIRRIEILLSRIRWIVGFFHRSTTAAVKLRSQAELLGLPDHKLIADVPTRWNSTYDMISRFLEMQCAVIAVLRSKDLAKIKEKDLSTLSDDDISLADKVMICLKPLKSGDNHSLR